MTRGGVILGLLGGLALGAAGTALLLGKPASEGAAARLPAATNPDQTVLMEAASGNFSSCLVCHGAYGQGNEVIGGPALAGMEDWYLNNQIEAFRAGWRGQHPDDLMGMEMRPSAMALTPSQITLAVSYMTRLDPAFVPATLDGDADRGAEDYAVCASCHGAQAEGNAELQAPALAYQADWYLVRQLTNFRDGVRGLAEGDERGHSMYVSAQGLTTDQAILDVVAHIKSLATATVAGNMD